MRACVRRLCGWSSLLRTRHGDALLCSLSFTHTRTRTHAHTRMRVCLLTRSADLDALEAELIAVVKDAIAALRAAGPAACRDRIAALVRTPPHSLRRALSRPHACCYPPVDDATTST